MKKLLLIFLLSCTETHSLDVAGSAIDERIRPALEAAMDRDASPDFSELAEFAYNASQLQLVDLLHAALVDNKPHRALRLINALPEGDLQAAVVNQLHYGSAALHLAAKYNHVDLVNTLLDAGAEIHKNDSRGNTALHIAATCGNTTFIAALLRKGAHIYALGKDDHMPLHCAMQAGHFDATQILLEEMPVGRRGSHLRQAFATQKAFDAWLVPASVAQKQYFEKIFKSINTKQKERMRRL